MTTEHYQAPVNITAMLVNSVITNSRDIYVRKQQQHVSWAPVFRAYDIAGMISKVGDPILILLGTFGNVMTILIMSRLPVSTSSAFFQLLAFSDQVQLILSPLQRFLHRAFDIPYITSQDSWMCKSYFMISYMVGVLSPLILVTLTLQRAASVLWPHRVNAVWTRRTSRVVAGVLVVVITMIHGHMLYGWDRDTVGCNNFHDCCYGIVSETYDWFWENVWTLVYNTLSSYLPFGLLVLSNSVLLWTLVRSVRTGRHLPVQQATQDSRQRKVSSLTVTLITISAAFILLSAPMTVSVFLSQWVDKTNPVEVADLYILRSISAFLWHCNSGVNFYLYCLTGSKLRAEFQRMVLQLISLCHRTQTASSELRSTRSTTMTSSSAGVSVGVNDTKTSSLTAMCSMTSE